LVDIRNSELKSYRRPSPLATQSFILSGMTLWDDIRRITGAQTVTAPVVGDAVLLPVPGLGTGGNTFWMVGPYKDQTRLATDLRINPTAQDFVADHHVRLGFRSTDVPPAGLNRQVRYGTTIVGGDASKNFVGQRVNPLSAPVNPGSPPLINRLSDREENVKRFWASQTPQSHHIVEFNHLRDIGVSNRTGLGPMDHGQLPCVLLAAEFHQRYVSSILKRTHGWSAAQLRAGMPQTYSSIYVAGGAAFRPLWEVSRIILRAAGLAVP
jgi:hypothetical protein